MASEDVEFKCHVSNLAMDIKRYELENAFSQFGDVIEVYVVYPSEHDYDHPRAYGFVTFENEKSMRDAINGMNGQKLDNGIYSITVEEAHSSRRSRRSRRVVSKKKV
ncbi:unnamed protein product [Microthlaspi erraticum]|uniref:RRM domain-containing protein n=1 Tax=Microthlaspi erraticum TaxID=1685480 RepID=A0A6D2JYE1_9BRAS|nr:unnamed protein product [Microthlaspi erraticum]